MRENRGSLLLAVPVIFIPAIIILITFALTWKPQVQDQKITSDTGNPTTTPTTIENPKMPDGYPPLYPGVEWEKKEKSVVSFRDKENNFIDLESSGYEAKELKNQELLLIDYCVNELMSLGWSESWSADGPGGVYYGFQKNGKFLQFGVQKRAEQKPTAFIDFN